MNPSAVLLASFVGVVLSACSSSNDPNQSGSTVRAVSGGGQTVTVQAVATEPLVAQVVDPSGAPVADVTVGFSTKVPGLFSTVAKTDANGMTQTVFTAGTRTGLDSITATTSGATSPGIFVITITPGPPSLIRKLSGDGQVAPPGTALSFPLVIDVKDQFNNNIEGVAVAWSADGGTTSAATTPTDSVGQAKVTYTLPATAGKWRITAHVDGITDAVFIATAK